MGVIYFWMGVFRMRINITMNKKNITEFKTERLLLRPFLESDVPAVTQLAGDRAIADTTLLIPHPYTEDDAKRWIRSHPKSLEDGKESPWAITLKESKELIGAIGIEVEPKYFRGELGYWIGKPYWGKGYATEAVGAMIRYGFDELGLNRIYATHFKRNVASGKVMQKNGMIHEGTLREWVFKWGKAEDSEMYSILREEYLRGT